MSGIGAVENESVLFAYGGRTNGVFNKVVVDFQMSVAGIAGQSLSEVQRIIHRWFIRLFGRYTSCALSNFRWTISRIGRLLARRAASRSSGDVCCSPAGRFRYGRVPGCVPKRFSPGDDLPGHHKTCAVHAFSRPPAPPPCAGSGFPPCYKMPHTRCSHRFEVAP